MLILQSPGEIAFMVAGFSVYWYGIILALAVLQGVFVAEWIAKDLPANFFIDNSPLIIISGIIGARIYYCLLNFSYYIENPIEIFDIRQGGLSVHGMIIAGVGTIYFLAKKNKISFLKLADILACSVAIAQSIGRWGNFFNSEAFGLPTNAKWGLFIPESQRPLEYISSELFHPAFLYESLLDLVIFFVLVFILKKNKCSGTVFFTYLILYSIARICVEQIRLDSALYIGQIPVAQIVSVVLILCGLVGLIYISKKMN